MSIINISNTLCKISLITTFGFLISCSDQVKIQSCTPLKGIDEILLPGQIILLGEIHGTKEGPEYLGRIACLALEKGIPVTIGLELPHSNQSTIDEFLNSKGEEQDKRSILKLPFWSRDYQDGRASQAMLELLEYSRLLKSTGRKIDVLLIDNPGTGNRDLEMAEKVIQKSLELPYNVIIVLTGNYHNMIFEGSQQMGWHVLNEVGDTKVTSLNMAYSGGSAWVDVAGEGFGPVKFSGSGINQIGIFLDPRMGNYHGTLEVDSIHYSPPAKDQSSF